MFHQIKSGDAVLEAFRLQPAARPRGHGRRACPERGAGGARAHVVQGARWKPRSGKCRLCSLNRRNWNTWLARDCSQASPASEPGWGTGVPRACGRGAARLYLCSEAAAGLRPGLSPPLLGRPTSPPGNRAGRWYLGGPRTRSFCALRLAAWDIQLAERPFSRRTTDCHASSCENQGDGGTVCEGPSHLQRGLDQVRVTHAAGEEPQHAGCHPGVTSKGLKNRGRKEAGECSHGGW